VAEVFSYGWIQALEHEVPESLTDKLIPWLGIFWVFERSENFQRMTQILQRERDGTGEAKDLPIHL
jgi:hypothetical protein